MTTGELPGSDVSVDRLGASVSDVPLTEAKTWNCATEPIHTKQQHPLHQ
jgi:hypothetical protein